MTDIEITRITDGFTIFINLVTINKLVFENYQEAGAGLPHRRVGHRQGPGPAQLHREQRQDRGDGLQAAGLLAGGDCRIDQGLPDHPAERVHQSLTAVLPGPSPAMCAPWHRFPLEGWGSCIPFAMEGGRLS